MWRQPVFCSRFWHVKTTCKIWISKECTEKSVWKRSVSPVSCFWFCILLLIFPRHLNGHCEKHKTLKQIFDLNQPGSFYDLLTKISPPNLAQAINCTKSASDHWFKYNKWGVMYQGTVLCDLTCLTAPMIIEDFSQFSCQQCSCSKNCKKPKQNYCSSLCMSCMTCGNHVPALFPWMLLAVPKTNTRHQS